MQKQYAFLTTLRTDLRKHAHDKQRRVAALERASTKETRQDVWALATHDVTKLKLK